MGKGTFHHPLDTGGKPGLMYRDFLTPIRRVSAAGHSIWAQISRDDHGDQDETCVFYSPAAPFDMFLSLCNWSACHELP